MNTDHDTGSSQSPEDLDEQLERQLAEEMGDQDMEQLLAAGPASPEDTQKKDTATGGAIVRGRIAAVHGDDVFVDVHGVDEKNQGVVPLTQFERPPRVGSVMDFVVQRLDPSQGLIVLSREGAAGLATWDQLVRGNVLEARVVATNRGGLELEIAGGIKAFMPASGVDLHFVEDLEQFVGQKIRAQVQEINRQSKKIVLNRRSLLETERKTKEGQLWKEIQVGQSRQGVVTSMTHFGAFVDLGGVDGLIHVSDLSHSRVEDPSKVVRVGQSVTVQVLKIDTEKKRIGLGMKQVEPDPWQGISDRIRTGECLSVRVVRTADFGVFVEVEPGVEGLVPVSELGWKFVDNPSQVVSEGDVIQVMVLRIESEKRRMALSLKQAKGDPWVDIEKRYEKETLVEGTVSNIADFGAFVELEHGVEGLVHISELSHRRVNHTEDVLQVGQKHQFRILEVDIEQRRMRLSLKAVDTSTQTSGDKPNRSSKAKTHKKPTGPLKGGLE